MIHPEAEDRPDIGLGIGGEVLQGEADDAAAMPVRVVLPSVGDRLLRGGVAAGAVGIPAVPVGERQHGGGRVAIAEDQRAAGGEER